MEEIFSASSLKNAMKILSDEIACIDKKQIDQHKSITAEIELKHKNGLRWSPKTGQVVKIEFCS
jgi:hypothetical protein